MKIFAVFFFGLLPFLLQAQSPAGKWKSIDDSSGDAKSIIELSERNGKMYGKIIRIFTHAGEDPDPVCDKCPKDDTRFDQKIIGMEIIKGMTKNGNSWSGGDILDPESGKVYSCKLWVENSTLKVRGYIGPFYRTQTWVRAD